ncbi:biogenesis of lysosome-related organelles complex 1 subunit 6 isoform X2 [Hippopotamus amphibius kiboko]|uniref:biogenesis of lysosome-related organelles complex 1 subunit 6 isoform X2 n=1 Tax=Hippopotamus amphibius kiboko TaxID=575201 RepID=UPI002595F0E1|nr:biogenesis of lysosome-related organelles complex 1 subunit 6 isoform X2 [Hippopotamus amphibius kiboko]
MALASTNVLLVGDSPKWMLPASGPQGELQLPPASPGGSPRSVGLSDTSPDEGLIEDLTIEDKAVEQLAEGLLSHYLPDLQRSKQALQELTQNQVVLLDTLEQEISKFKECHSMLDINALFTEAKHYHTKLVNIRKEMLMLHEKTSKLKKRALKLQQKRQKEELEREQQREKEFEREKQLTAKPAKRTNSRKKIILTSTLTSTQTDCEAPHFSNGNKQQ